LFREYEEDKRPGEQYRDEPGEADAGAKGGPADGAQAAAEAVEGELVNEEAGAQPTVEQLQKELQEQKAAVDDYHNRLLRLQADFDNYRRRTAKEKEEFARYASAVLCESLLPVLDNFQLALNTKGQDAAAVVQGVEMIYRQLLETLQREGLTPMEVLGEQFDPTKHEAVMQESSGQYPDNTVIEELRRGYHLKDKLLRPAMVKVAKKE